MVAFIQRLSHNIGKHMSKDNRSVGILETQVISPDFRFCQT